MSPQDKASASRTGLVLSQRGEHSSPAASQPGARDGAGTDLADRAAGPGGPRSGGRGEAVALRAAVTLRPCCLLPLREAGPGPVWPRARLGVRSG